MQRDDKNGLVGFLALDKKGQLWGLEEAYSITGTLGPSTC